MSTIKIFGIDPGINATGWSVGIYDLDTQAIQVTAFGTIQANTLAKKEMKQDVVTYGNVVSLHIYERELSALFDQYHPDYVTCEDAFMHKFPQAYVSLKLCIATIQRVLFLKYHQFLYLIAPRAAKVTTSGTGTSDKIAIQDAIQHLPDLTIKDTKQKPIANMVEHEADSIAILYTFAKTILPDILIQK